MCGRAGTPPCKDCGKPLPCKVTIIDFSQVIKKSILDIR